MHPNKHHQTMIDRYKIDTDRLWWSVRLAMYVRVRLMRGGGGWMPYVSFIRIVSQGQGLFEYIEKQMDEHEIIADYPKLAMFLREGGYL